MKVLIAIPSHNRPYDIEKKLGYWLPYMMYDYKIFVEENQEMYYSQSIGSTHLVLTPNGSGLIGQLIEIGKYAESHGYDLVLKMDDDMRFTKDKSPKDETSLVVSEYIKSAIDLFTSRQDVAITNVVKPATYRYSNKEGWKIRQKPIYGNYMIRTEMFKCLTHEMLLFDDLVFSIEARKQGKMIYQYYGAYEDAITHKNAGGLQSYDRDQLSRKAFEYLKTKYPLLKEMPNNKNGVFDIDVSQYF